MRREKLEISPRDEAVRHVPTRQFAAHPGLCAALSESRLSASRQPTRNTTKKGHELTFRGSGTECIWVCVCKDRMFFLLLLLFYFFIYSCVLGFVFGTIGVFSFFLSFFLLSRILVVVFVCVKVGCFDSILCNTVLCPSAGRHESGTHVTRRQA